MFKQGHKQTISVRKKISKKMTGVVKTEIHKDNIRKARIGNKNPSWNGGHSKTYQCGLRRKLAPRPKPNQCEICGALGSDFKKGLCLDHDHKTDKFRGWICTRCNSALGFVKDSPELLRRLAYYLENQDN